MRQAEKHIAYIFYFYDKQALSTLVVMLGHHVVPNQVLPFILMPS